MAERAFFVLAYDITNDKRRARIARAMEAIGERVQGSVFEAYLAPAELEKVIQKTMKVMNEKEDSLRIYLLCSACRAKIQTRGLGKVTPPPGVMIV